MQNHQYIGRFAPSPTGLLHLGSLIAAMASYCQAMKQKGQWLLRIEDLDPPREIVGASKAIIQTLHELGFKFEHKILYQSHISRQDAYQSALNFLTENGHTYCCSCSRNDLHNIDSAAHKCRNQTQIPNKPYSIKLKVPQQTILFNDIIQGEYKINLFSECGDVVLKRKDGLFSYQIAVVVDDAFQDITDIIRGIDLIESTPWQIYLNSLLNYQQARYAHIPLLVNGQGQKLSKQTFAKEIDSKSSLNVLIKAYSYLRQTSFKNKPKSLKEFWLYAIKHWDINKIAKVTSIKV